MIIYDFTKYLMYIPKMVQLNSLSKCYTRASQEDAFWLLLICAALQVIKR
jgi:hypothetical protein